MGVTTRRVDVQTVGASLVCPRIGGGRRAQVRNIGTFPVWLGDRTVVADVAGADPEHTGLRLAGGDDYLHTDGGELYAIAENPGESPFLGPSLIKPAGYVGRLEVLDEQPPSATRPDVPSMPPTPA